jgi:hypothetical protein
MVLRYINNFKDTTCMVNANNLHINPVQYETDKYEFETKYMEIIRDDYSHSSPRNSLISPN